MANFLITRETLPPNKSGTTVCKSEMMVGKSGTTVGKSGTMVGKSRASIRLGS